MTQEKFIALSKEKVAKLNKGSKEAEEAWRAGYLYLAEQLRISFNNKTQLYFLEEVEEIMDSVQTQTFSIRGNDDAMAYIDFW